MVRAYIDETGIHVPSYPEILADQQARYRAIFGPDLYLEPDSQEGQLVAGFALAISDAYALAVSVYNSYSPQTAQGAGLSRMVKINGLARKGASHSTADVTVVGQAGTIITMGSVEDVAGQKWDLPASVAIPVGGEVTVTATAREPGEVRAAPGEINKIGTPTRGWQSVTNALAAVPGAAVESDSALRGRQTVSTALPSRTVMEGIMGAVASLPGVARLRGYENDADEEDENGIPAHTISLVVEGGDAQEIAQAIARKKGPGCGTYGDTTSVVRDKFGIPASIRFWRPAVRLVAAQITIAPRPGYVSSTGEAIRAGVASHLNSLGIGEDCLLSKLYTPINGAEPNPSIRTFDVVGLQIGADEAPVAAANIPVAFNEVIVADVADIVVTVA